MFDLLERPKILNGLPPEVVERIEDFYCRDLAARSKPGGIFYAILLLIIWTTTSFRVSHPREVLGAIGVAAIGLVFRVQFGWKTGPGFATRRSAWSRQGALAIVCLSSSISLILARVIQTSPFSYWDYCIIMTWSIALACTSIFSFNPSFKLLRIQIFLLLLPPCVAGIWEGGFRNNCFAASQGVLILYLLMQGKQLYSSYWEQLVSRHLEDMRRQELLSAKLEAEEAQKRAELATKVRSEFLANMSHEIRTPMNAVLGMTTLLLNQGFDGETLSYLNTIRTSSESLLTIINDILDFSKIESGMLELEQSSFLLGDCVEDSLELLATAADDKELLLTSSIEHSIAATVLGDMTRLRQILVNLISNAVKFTEEGEVVVSVNRRSSAEGLEELVFSVKDTGMGIPADRLTALFSSFTQVDSSITRRFGGTGLGLAISKRLTEIMGGRIWVDSQLSIGSSFSFAIPYRPVLEMTGSGPVFASLANKRVLLIDQHSTTLGIYQAQLQTWGMEVIAVSSEEQALPAVSAGNWDLIIVDQLIEQLGQAVRGELGEKTPPLLLLCSGRLSLQYQNGNVPPPFSAHLPKPVRRQQLGRMVSRLVGNEVAETFVPRTKLLNTDFGRQFPLSILVAEDNLINQKVAQRLLEQLGYCVDIVNNGLEALAALERRSYNCLLLDIQMPELDGLETAKRVCALNKPGKQPWMIALTAGAMKGDRDECLRVGIHDYVAKPIRVADLKSALERCHQGLSARAESTVANHEDLAVVSM